MQKTNSIPWMVSLHGGHSGQFCDHATGNLRDLVEAAIDRKMSIFGLSEHCPRYQSEHLFPQEKRAGWDVKYLEQLFDSYAEESHRLQQEYSAKLEILRGFETEVIDFSYYPMMLELRRKYQFDYIIGSVHHVRGICIDGWQEHFDETARLCGGLESMAIEYYRSVQDMVEKLSPEVVGHIDLLSKFCADYELLSTPAIRQQMRATLQTIKSSEAILDLNVYPLRKGKKYPYPAPWIVSMASEMGIPFCFGDDSHSVDSVGVGIEQGREYLLSLGVDSICCLSKVNDTVVRKHIELK